MLSTWCGASCCAAVVTGYQWSSFVVLSMQGCHPVPGVTPCSTVFLTHGHLDHCGSVHMHAAQRGTVPAIVGAAAIATYASPPTRGGQTWLAGMKKLTPPNVYLPPENLDDMRAALDVRPAQWFWSVRRHFPHRCDGIPRPTHASIKPKSGVI